MFGKKKSQIPKATGQKKVNVTLKSPEITGPLRVINSRLKITQTQLEALKKDLNSTNQDTQIKAKRRVMEINTAVNDKIRLFNRYGLKVNETKARNAAIIWYTLIGIEFRREQNRPTIQINFKPRRTQ